MKIDEISQGISQIKSTAASPLKNEAADETKSFDSYLNKTYSYEDIINIAAKEFNVPVNLIKSVIMMESSFDPNAVSYCGATGLMQLMPEAAAEVGVTDAYDPVQNIMGGTKLLARFLKKYDGNTDLALAAYNGGPGNVSKYGGVPPFCEDYVARIKGFMSNGVHVPDKYVTVNITDYASSAVTNNVTKKSDTAAAANATLENASAITKEPVKDNVTSNNPLSAEDDTQIYDPSQESVITSAFRTQLYEAFKNYSNYMRVLDLISQNDDKEN